MIAARQATSEELQPVAETLARAFHDDPVMVWLFGEGDRPRMRHLRRYFSSEARRHQRHGGTVLTADGLGGGAFWEPPGGWHIGWPAMLRAAPMMLSCIGPRIPRALRGLDQIERVHPRVPHWYLAVVGTDPPQQGKGLGGALLDPILSRCDTEGSGAYLESSKPENVPWYERYGFAVTSELTLPDGPPLWSMWRDPR